MVGGLTWLVMLHGVEKQGKSEDGRRAGRSLSTEPVSQVNTFLNQPRSCFTLVQRLHYILASFSSAGVIAQEVRGRVSPSAKFHDGAMVAIVPLNIE